MNIKNKIITESLEGIDLSPTMEINAREKYKAISKYLENNGIESDFCPQGSFLIGTVVKPYVNGKSQNYDLDILIRVLNSKESISPCRVKNEIGDILKDSDLYKSKLDKEDANCWTLHYAEISSGIEFSMDLVPSVNENTEIKNEILNSGVSFDFAYEAVSITKKKDYIYSRLTSNPIGFGKWFLNISNRHLTEESKRVQYKKLDKNVINVLNKAERIPDYIYKSSLQMATQFIKRHRDIYYDRSNKNNSKPSSILLSSLIADSVKDEYFFNTEEIIKTFIYKFENNLISIMKDGKILNPVDQREDLFEKYSYFDRNLMRKWIRSLKNDIDLTDEAKFRNRIHNSVNENLYITSMNDFNRISPKKPWRSSI